METNYRCQQCKAEDRDHGTGGPPPMALICWSCKAGRGMAPHDQFQNNVGMLPQKPKS